MLLGTKWQNPFRIILRILIFLSGLLNMKFDSQLQNNIFMKFWVCHKNLISSKITCFMKSVCFGQYNSTTRCLQVKWNNDDIRDFCCNLPRQMLGSFQRCIEPTHMDGWMDGWVYPMSASQWELLNRQEVRTAMRF